MKRWGIVLVLVLVTWCTTAMAATIRPDGDPPAGVVIWADPFDYYNQWAWDNRDNTAYTRGTVWQGGPIPPLANPDGSLGYPTKMPGTPWSGCGVTIQTSPADHEMARAQWLGNDCATITTPGGRTADRSSFEANVDPCSGGVATTHGQLAMNNSTWGMGGSYNSLGQFTHYFGDRIQTIATRQGLGVKNAVNGTDAHPLVVIFYLNDHGTAVENPIDLYDNSYVELSMTGGLTNRNDPDSIAPTDYIWMGDPAGTGMDYCPQGPYPVVCQQVREVNDDYPDEAYYLTYVNAHCPPLVPPHDPNTNTGKTWRSFAIGYLAITDINPCGVTYQGSDPHKPTADRLAVFDGNQWRQFRDDRFRGLDKTTWPPAFPWDPGMELNPDEAAKGDKLDLQGGTTRIVLKIVSDYILVFATTGAGTATQAYHGAAVPRVYKGPFDTIRWGVGPGCELDPTTYQCKEGGTPRQCLTYSTNFAGYDRTQMDSMSIFYGELQYYDLVHGRCCHLEGTCEVTDQLTCVNSGGTFAGVGTTCDGDPCLGACCQPMGICEQTAINACPGEFKGYGSSCATADICPCRTPAADADWDGDVDQVDFAAFQACYTGSVTGEGLSPGCACFDRSPAGGNDAIDQDDYSAFEQCASGPGIPANPGC
ncbi:MAG: hypothetical protein QUV05_11830 [Phycisphaerae bacterium]|nr:hypothetical protein [Phycisphaerae bacterium]